MTYIRRKVFSLLEDESGEARYFSTTEYEYDVEERIFSEEEDEPKKKKKHVGAKIAAGTVGTVGGGLAVAKGMDIIGDKILAKEAENGGKKFIERVKSGKNPLKEHKKVVKLGESMKTPWRKVNEVFSSETGKRIANAASHTKERAGLLVKSGKAGVSKGASKVSLLVGGLAGKIVKKAVKK